MMLQRKYLMQTSPLKVGFYCCCIAETRCAFEFVFEGPEPKLKSGLERVAFILSTRA